MRPGTPYSVVSALTMLEVSATWFARIINILEKLEKHLHNSEGLAEDAQFSPEDLTYFIEFADRLEKNCKKLQLSHALARITRLRELLAGEPTVNDIRTESRVIKESIMDQLEGRMLLVLPDDTISFYEDPVGVLGGDQVAEAFPLAVPDMVEASKSFAMGRHTASVFHLMRVMEHVLLRVADRLRITIDVTANWQIILDQVNKALNNLPKPKTKADGQFRTDLSELTAHLYAVKHAWRNPTMHPLNTYTGDDARVIFGHVSSFLTSARKVLPPPRKRRTKA
jgi:hypothetical protein